MNNTILTALACTAMLVISDVHADDEHDHGNHDGSHGNGYAVSAACEDGWAGDYACSRINLISYMNTTLFNAGSLSDVWGWVDPDTQNEYVLVGHFNGTSFVRITWPDMPELVGFLPAHEDLVATAAKGVAGKSCAIGRGKAGAAVAHDEEGCGDGEGSTWRDIKVYANHAFIVSESTGHGLQIFDLTRLRDGAADTVYDEDAHIATFGNAHNIAINEDTGVAYVVGAGPFNGGLIFFDVSDPQQTQPLGGFSADGYTHDVQCVVYNGPDTQYVGREICFACNEDTVTIVDVTDKSDPVAIAIGRYANSQYVHQGWLSTDQRYFYQNDELDEQGGLPQTRTLIWDMSSLDNPRMVKEHMGIISSVDHNNYTLGEYLFQSNYTTGLRVLSTKDPVELLEIAYFDTFPANDGTTFSGTWSNYPYFPSGVVAVTDRNEGLYILQPAFMDNGLAEGDLQVTLSAATEIDTTSTRSAFRYEATVTNPSAVDLHDVKMTHILPPGVTFDLVDATATCTQRAQFLDCNIGLMAAGTDQAITIEAAIPGTTSAAYEVRASAMNSDPNQGNNKASNTVALSFTPPPAPEPVTPVVNNNSGGGGGGVGWLSLLLLGWRLQRGEFGVR